MATPVGISISADGKTWTRDGKSFAVGDFVYVAPDTFAVTEAAAKVDTEPVPGYAAKGGYVKVRRYSACSCHWRMSYVPTCRSLDEGTAHKCP